MKKNQEDDEEWNALCVYSHVFTEKSNLWLSVESEQYSVTSRSPLRNILPLSPPTSFCLPMILCITLLHGNIGIQSLGFMGCSYSLNEGKQCCQIKSCLTCLFCSSAAPAGGSTAARSEWIEAFGPGEKTPWIKQWSWSTTQNKKSDMKGTIPFFKIKFDFW